MIRTLISAIQPGHVVGASVYDERGRVLVAAGVTLNEGLIAAIRKRGYMSLYLQNGVADDIVPEDIVSDHVRATTIQHIHDVFQVSRAALGLSGQGMPGGPAVLARDAIDSLSRDVDLIMQEVLESSRLTGLSTLKSHDNYTFSHSVDVAVTSILLGARLLLPREEMHHLALGALLHDIGKIFVPDSIIRKPGPLTPEEFDVMKSHTTEGYRYLIDGELNDFRACGITHQHHERQDGSGYPRGLRGANRLRRSEQDRWDRDRIHPLAEIASVADVYSALASDRPYRATMPPEQVAATIRDMAGHHLNAEVVDCFLSNVPIFPVGAEIAIEGGRYDGYRGVVTENRRGRLDRPYVRLTQDARGQRLTPDDFDPATDSAARVVSPTDLPVPEVLV